MVPQATTIAFLSGGSESSQQNDLIAPAARELGLQVIVVEVPSERDIEPAFATIVQRKAEALIVGVVPHFTYNSRKTVRLAMNHKIPAMFPFSIYAFGGLMSYGADMAGNLRQVGEYVARILNGANPADLPIQQPTKFPMIINLNAGPRSPVHAARARRRGDRVEIHGMAALDHSHRTTAYLPRPLVPRSLHVYAHRRSPGPATRLKTVA